VETVGASYFAALDEPLLAGREFEELDLRSLDGQTSDAIQDQQNHPVGLQVAVSPIVLNESAARGLFGNSNAIGKRIRDEKQSLEYEVSGVVRDLKDGSGVVQSIAYMPLTRRDFARPPAGGIIIIVRSDAGRDALTGALSAMASIDPNLNLFDVQTLGEYLERSRYVMWSAIRTYGGIGMFGLVLSAIGLAGVTAYAVAQRRREIGIRMALGARKGQVLRLVLREGTALVIVGTALGFLGAFALSKVLASLTNEFADAFKTGTNDPRLLVGAPVLLAGLAMLACYIPARAAVLVNPLTALRQQ
jgi:ABC-type antimicrobial peptide transport system permease subunit